MSVTPSFPTRSLLASLGDGIDIAYLWCYRLIFTMVRHRSDSNRSEEKGEICFRLL